MFTLTTILQWFLLFLVEKLGDLENTSSNFIRNSYKKLFLKFWEVTFLFRKKYPDLVFFGSLLTSPKKLICIIPPIVIVIPIVASVVSLQNF